MAIFNNIKMHIFTSISQVNSSSEQRYMYQGVQCGVVYTRNKLRTSQWPSEGEIDYGTLRTIKLFKE